MSGKIVGPLLATFLLISAHLVHAQQSTAYRVGVIHEGGFVYNSMIDGLKDGLRDLGFAEGKQYILEIRDLRSDRKAAVAAARSLEQEKVDLLYTLSASVTTAVKGATTRVPIVFAVGGDPVVAGLVESFAKPGGRLTGVHYQQSADIVSKRLDITKALLPGLRKVVTFYDPGNAIATASIRTAREAARQLSIELVERPVASAEELRRSVLALQAREFDAYIYINDAMVTSQAQFLIDAAKARKLPTMFGAPSLVAQGALAAYGVSYREAGRLSAKYVQRVLTGTSPQNLPVESLNRVELAVNLKTAREIGVTISQALLLRADEVVQ